jgi:hypothetical protein
MFFHNYEDVRGITAALNCRVLQLPDMLRFKHRSVRYRIPPLIPENKIRGFDSKGFMTPKLNISMKDAVKIYDKVTYALFVAPDKYSDFGPSWMSRLFEMEGQNFDLYNFQNRDMTDKWQALIVTLNALRHTLKGELVIGDGSLYISGKYEIGIKNGVLLGKFNKGMQVNPDVDFEHEFKRDGGIGKTHIPEFKYLLSKARFSKNEFPAGVAEELEHLLIMLVVTSTEKVIRSVVETLYITYVPDNYRTDERGRTITEVMTSRVTDQMFKIMRYSPNPIGKIKDILVPTFLPRKDFGEQFSKGSYTTRCIKSATRERFLKKLELTLRVKESEVC